MPSYRDPLRVLPDGEESRRAQLPQRAARSPPRPAGRWAAWARADHCYVEQAHAAALQRLPQRRDAWFESTNRRQEARPPRGLRRRGACRKKACRHSRRHISTEKPPRRRARRRRPARRRCRPRAIPRRVSSQTLLTRSRPAGVDRSGRRWPSGPAAGAAGECDRSRVALHPSRPTLPQPAPLPRAARATVSSRRANRARRQRTHMTSASSRTRAAAAPASSAARRAWRDRCTPVDDATQAPARSRGGASNRVRGARIAQQQLKTRVFIALVDSV